ncbi:MAG TPA: FHA domain-containing protein, partial [Streptosporangiaceae bacterium]|nr:FHA domain-containing protein [Streptosporangiaceae bacterium]
MAICPNGHDSAAADYCDVCGHHIAKAPASDPVRTVGKHHAPRPGAAPSPAETCPRCGTVSS